MEKNVHNGHRRHKCSICGKVRNEKYMEEIEVRGQQITTRWGNGCWACIDTQECQTKAGYFRSY